MCKDGLSLKSETHDPGLGFRVQDLVLEGWIASTETTAIGMVLNFSRGFYQGGLITHN